jgi:RNA polymerase sigma-70 factor (ECF subfamily)
MEKADTIYDFADCGERELEAVIKEYGPALLRYCHNVLCDYHEAQDALQVTFIKAYDKRKSFKNGSPLSPWLYRIAYTTCMDILRRKKLSFILPPSKQQSEEKGGHIPENIRAALMTLSPSDRALVFSRVMERRPYEELAEIHGKSAAALRKRYERARHKLAEALKTDYPYYSKEESK